MLALVGALLLQWSLQAHGACISPAEPLESCDMVDYRVYTSLQVSEAEQQAVQVSKAQVSEWRARKGRPGYNKLWDRLSFCEELIEAVACNLLIPPCEGDGTERYRKPCKAYALALEAGCNWTNPYGDLAFAEPPDCYELPARNYGESEFLDAGSIGAMDEGDFSRADDLLEIAKLLKDAGESGHAVHTLLQAMRHRPSDEEAPALIFSIMHSTEEHLKSLKMQIKSWDEYAGDKDCAIMSVPIPADYHEHQGIPEPRKAHIILDYAARHKAKTFIETGTWYGETLNMVKGSFDRLVSIEISAQIADLARKRFASDRNIEIVTGDSVRFLAPVAAGRDRSLATVFWLDGHFSGSRFETAKAALDNPILLELETTLREVEEEDVVLIDDARMFTGFDRCQGNFKSECFPSLDDLKKIVCRLRPHWSFTVADDMIRIEHDSSTSTARKHSKKAKTKKTKEEKKIKEEKKTKVEGPAQDGSSAGAAGARSAASNKGGGNKGGVGWTVPKPESKTAADGNTQGSLAAGAGPKLERTPPAWGIKAPTKQGAVRLDWGASESGGGGHDETRKEGVKEAASDGKGAFNIKL